MAAKTKRKTGESRSFRPLLKQIVKFLNVNDPAAKDLWWVLTALRGPDDGPDMVKQATTAVIRHSIGIESDTGNGAVVAEDTSDSKDYRKNMSNWRYHFKGHAKEAFKALGLEWEEVNQ